MSYKDITAGDKVGIAMGIRRIVSTEKKTEGVEVEFSFEEPSTGQTERLCWQGWLSPAARTRTLETLRDVLGSNLNISENVEEGTGILKDPNILDYTRKVKLDVGIEPYTDKKDGSTKYSAKIKWVNRLGGTSFVSADVKTIKARDDSSGLTAAILAAKQKAPQSQTPVSTEEVPF